MTKPPLCAKIPAAFVDLTVPALVVLEAELFDPFCVDEAPAVAEAPPDPAFVVDEVEFPPALAVELALVPAPDAEVPVATIPAVLFPLALVVL